MRIALANMKGGVGKTTSSIYLAAACVVAGIQVKVHDLDPQGGASKWRRLASAAGMPLPFDVVVCNADSILDLEQGNPSHFDIIDAPPSGNGLDMCLQAADLVIVPCTDSPSDVQQTFATLQVLAARHVACAVLLCRVEQHTRAYTATIREFDSAHVTRFDTVIEKCQQIKAGPGQSLALSSRSNPKLCGYGQVLSELREELAS